MAEHSRFYSSDDPRRPMRKKDLGLWQKPSVIVLIAGALSIVLLATAWTVF